MIRQTMGALGLFAAGVTTALAHSGGEHAAEGFGHSHMGGWMFLGPLVTVAMVAGAVVLVVLLLRWLGIGLPAAPRRSALDILEGRYARGEIDRDEFEERRRVIED